jgi:hypothetical protein
VLGADQDETDAGGSGFNGHEQAKWEQDSDKW